MLTNIKNLGKSYKARKNWMVETKLDSLRALVEGIRKLDYRNLEDSRLKELFLELSERAKNGTPLDELLIEAYALVCEAVKRVLGMCPFDVQLMAAIAMHQGKLAEMQTGEGKTLAAVFPACLNALDGKGVHILTFNDYLARRDAAWMGPVYRFLGLTAGYVQEEMTSGERKKAYSSDITYVTAKEAGFDYLRGFLCHEKEELVHRAFNCAIVDEADSILIDEARIPLVIAGSTPEKEYGPERMARVVRELRKEIDYKTDEYGRNVYLTEEGAARTEQLLGLLNLYSDENLEPLTLIYCALHAEVLLKRDVDYIVREGRIELVDEFTGRVAENRHWPDGLQAAVEAKEGLRLQDKGRILGTVTLQSFIRTYPKLSGMTATARASAEELVAFYNLTVAVIPPNKPCIRIDHPDVVFTHKEAKYKGLISEIEKVNSTGRPILVGTCSVEESERIASLLKKTGVHCQVLNAKNDEFEAGIVAKAGALGAVTVSTNMAGRGTDIRLGGENEEDRDKVVALGGLYVIGTNRHESSRVDNQLRGRAGRQGDPGSTRFFISLEDDLIKKFGIEKTIPGKYLTNKQDTPLNNPVVNQRTAHVQRIVEGQNFDMRKTLWDYSYLIEEQRKVIHKRRQEILLDKTRLNLLSEKSPERYSELVANAGAEAVRKAEKQITLFHIDECWADYLSQVAYIKEGIHLVRIGHRDPFQEFQVMVVKAFDEMLGEIEHEVVNTFKRVRITPGGIDMEAEGLKRPSSTWTYMVNDNPFADNVARFLTSSGNAGFGSVAVAVEWPLVLASTIFDFLVRKKKEKQ